MAKRILKVVGIIVLIIVILFVALIAFLSATEYKPDYITQAEMSETSGNVEVDASKSIDILTWNIGYAGLGANEDFFMDGGSNVNPESQDEVTANLEAIGKFIKSENADINLLQELDESSSRTGKIDERKILGEYLGLPWSFGINYKCSFVPYPIPMIGKVYAGVATYSNYSATSSERVSLPCPFKWPIRTANMKRCMLVNRYNISNSDKELVVINLHLEAYSEDSGRAEQLKVMLNLMEEEYEKGNYVIAGGDFNQMMPGSTSKYPIKVDEWLPNELDASELSSHFKYVYDVSEPTCRLLNQAYDPADTENTQYYVIDGFIVSDNVNVESVKAINLDFQNSDHNPVKLQVSLK